MTDPTEDLDRLIARLAGRDRAALKAIYDVMAPKLFPAILRMARDGGLAEDLLERAFLRIWREAPAFGSDDKALPWLMGIARSTATEGLPRGGEGRRRELDGDRLAELAGLPLPAGLWRRIEADVEADDKVPRAAATDRIGAGPLPGDSVVLDRAPKLSIVPEPVFSAPRAEQRAGDAGPRLAGGVHHEDELAPDAVFGDPGRGLRRWRFAAVLLLFVALGLGAALAFVLMRPWLSVPLDGRRSVAVLDREATEPAAIVEVDTGRGTVALRTLAVEPAPPGRSLELWVTPPGGAPRFLGRLPEQGGALSLIDRGGSIPAGATFSITLEPEGGRPDGLPAGAALYVGRLVDIDP